jgi:hypothetical protein
MRGALPAPLSSLLASRDPRSREEAWAAFLSTYSTLIMRVARLLGGDEDAVMDRYAFALDQLCRDDCKRLRQYTADGRGEFTTWLVLVVRRLCLDEHRRRYGRRQSDDGDAAERHAARRRLADLFGSRRRWPRCPTKVTTRTPGSAPPSSLPRSRPRSRSWTCPTDFCSAFVSTTGCRFRRSLV